MSFFKNLFGRRDADSSSSKAKKAGIIFICGYTVTPGSKLHRQAVNLLRLGNDEKLETNVNITFPEADIIDRLVKEWEVIGRGVITDEQKQAMYRREKEIGQILNDLGGIDLMRAVAYKLIDNGLAFESDFFTWNGIGGWLN